MIFMVLAIFEAHKGNIVSAIFSIIFFILCLVSFLYDCLKEEIKEIKELKNE